MEGCVSPSVKLYFTYNFDIVSIIVNFPLLPPKVNRLLLPPSVYGYRVIKEGFTISSFFPLSFSVFLVWEPYGTPVSQFLLKLISLFLMV